MSEFKIEYDDSYNKYVVCRKEYKWRGFSYNWIKLNNYQTLEAAETALREYKSFPKYYEF
jgi:hypothetical protein